MPDSEKPQPDKFRDLAHQLGCDEDEARFEGQVRRIATAPKPETNKSSKTHPDLDADNR